MDQERIYNKLEKIDTRLNSIDTTLAAQHISLTEHMRRTALAEKNHELLRTEFQPVKEHVLRVDGAIKLIALVATLVAIIAAIINILD